MGAKHTPGPWRVAGFAIVADSAISTHCSVDEVRAYGGSLVCESVKEGNRSLIAAAPDMLAALKVARQFIENGVEFGFVRMPDPSMPDPAHNTLPAINAAIAAATGSAE